MPQITRDFLDEQVRQLVEIKGRQLADLNSTLGALLYVQKLFAFIDLPEPVDRDGSSTVTSDVEAAADVGERMGGDPEC